jgi:hypothetical protein
MSADISLGGVLDTFRDTGFLSSGSSQAVMSTSAVQKEIQRRAMHALNDGDVMDFGTVLAQEHGRSLYGAIPKQVAVEEAIEQSSELSVAYHPASGSVILTPTE